MACNERRERDADQEEEEEEEKKELDLLVHVFLIVCSVSASPHLQSSLSGLWGFFVFRPGPQKILLTLPGINVLCGRAELIRLICVMKARLGTQQNDYTIYSFLL